MYCEFLHKADGSVLVMDKSLTYEELQMLMTLTGGLSYYWPDWLHEDGEIIAGRENMWRTYARDSINFMNIKAQEVPAEILLAFALIGS